MVSFYIRANYPTNSNVKFGSYDLAGIAPGANLAMYKTASLSTWGIFADKLKCNNHELYAGTREFLFDMNIPYIYLPGDDWDLFADAMILFDADIICDKQ